VYFRPTPLDGAVEVHLDRHEDARGYFARAWCVREFAANGLPVTLVQSSVSFNARKGTLRGMHFQWPPSREGKLVRCEAGAVWDVLVDLRPGSRSFLEHYALELDGERGNAVYIPPGFAHGFQTLSDDTRVLYVMTDFYDPGLGDGVSYDDVAFGIDWPLPVSVISPRDKDYPSFDRERYVRRYEQSGG
jgi:dTDP-4-dehydrorhamnose 3,5-epimerase